jgi:prepilin-type N-terminal cleavage/methylation domain-containing protein
MNKINFKAFTLAEVLITLLIIGVVTSLVIPSLINDTQDAELKVAWKKSYSDVDKLVKLVLVDNGGSMKGLFTDYNSMKNVFKPYLQYTKECASGSASGYCWHEANNWSYLNGTLRVALVSSAIVLNDGRFLFFEYSSSNCSNQIGTSGFYRCGMIGVDVNGFKPPNVMGEDIFSIYVTENGTKPRGIPNDFAFATMCRERGTSGWTDSNNQGYACAGKYLYQ